MRIFWYLARIMSIILILFTGIFALDSFDQPQWFLALFIHLIPTFGLIVLTIITWKYERMGGIVVAVAGLILLILSRLEAYVIALPLMILGIFFIFSSMRGENDGKIKTQ